MKKYNLENLRIHELRILARQLEINSPTSKKKSELIELIDLALKDKLPEEYRESKIHSKGRPVMNGKVVDVTDSIPLLIELCRDIEKINSLLNKLNEKIKRCIK